MINNTERIRDALEGIKAAAAALTALDTNTKKFIIEGILEKQKIPMLSFVTPVILNLANNKNLSLIIETVNEMLLDLKEQ